MKDAKIEETRDSIWLDNHVICGFERSSRGSTEMYLCDTYGREPFRISANAINKLKEYLDSLDAAGKLRARDDS